MLLIRLIFSLKFCPNISYNLFKSKFFIIFFIFFFISSFVFEVFCCMIIKGVDLFVCKENVWFVKFEDEEINLIINDEDDELIIFSTWKFWIISSQFVNNLILSELSINKFK